LLKQMESEEHQSKKERYQALTEQSEKCCKCKGVVNPAKCAEGEFDRPAHIGPWTDWQGNLDAEIMVVGQEWGGTKDYLKQLGKDRTGNNTNGNLIKLMASIGEELPPPEVLQGVTEIGKYFFTNCVLCLCDGNSSSSSDSKSKHKREKVKKSTYYSCAEIYLKQQINIVEPRFILVLGMSAWNALMRTYSKIEANAYEDVVGKTYVMLNDKTTAFPLFHCSPVAVNLNRSFAEQVEDWKRVKTIMEKLKGGCHYSR